MYPIQSYRRIFIELRDGCFHIKLHRFVIFIKRFLVHETVLKCLVGQLHTILIIYQVLQLLDIVCNRNTFRLVTFHRSTRFQSALIFLMNLYHLNLEYIWWILVFLYLLLNHCFIHFFQGISVYLYSSHLILFYIWKFVFCRNNIIQNWLNLVRMKNFISFQYKICTNWCCHITR